MFEKIKVPSFIKNFTVIGIGETFNGSFHTILFYVQGYQPGLMEFGHVRFLEKGWSGGPETEIEVDSIRPALVLDIAETADVFEKVA